MQAGIMTRLFLGAESRYGYYSLYGSLSAREADAAQYIIKGGHAYGKNVFLEKLSELQLASGRNVEVFYNTIQREYIDGIFIPEIKTSFFDGEPPHTVNALYPGAVETYIDLSPLYDSSKLRRERESIIALTASQNQLRVKLYRYLCAAGELRDNIGSSVYSEETLATIRRRARGILAREFPKGNGGTGGIKNRFISVSTGTGQDYSEMASRCERVCIIDNDFGLAHELLTELVRGVSGAGHEVTVILDPLEPERIMHIIIPGIGLAFISKTTRDIYDGSIYKHYRLDALPREALSSAAKASIKADRRLYSALLDKAEETVREISGFAVTVGGVYTALFDKKSAEDLAVEYAAKLK